jgi:hypothetical protein
MSLLELLIVLLIVALLIGAVALSPLFWILVIVIALVLIVPRLRR